MKIYPTRDMAVNGQHAEAGKPVEVSEADAKYLIATGAATKDAPGKASKAKADAAD